MKRLALAMVVLSTFAFGFQAKEKPTFTKNVFPTLRRSCLRCHTGPLSKGKADLSKIKTEADAKKYSKMLKTSWKEMQKGTMPPQGERPVKPEHMKLFGDFVKTLK
jgi:hypothetical protein